MLFSVQEIIEEGESSRAKDVLNDERYKSFKVNLWGLLLLLKIEYISFWLVRNLLIDATIL